jgi:PAS domain S-box-containing protein
MLFVSTVIKGVALLSYVALALLTLRSRAETPVRILFSIYLLGMLFWQSTSLVVNFSASPESALMWYNLLIAGSATFNALFFPFSRAFLRIRGQKVLTVLSYASCVIIFVGGVLALPFHSVTIGRGGYWVPVYDSIWLYILGPFGFFFWLCGIVNLVRGLLREKSPVQRNRIAYLLVGACIVLLGVTTNLTALRDYPVDISLNLVSALVIGYAVVRYRLLDIRVILARSLSYSVLTGVLIAAYLGIVVGLEHVLAEGLGYTGPAYGIVATLVLALAFLPLRNLLQRVVDRVFFREKADYQKVTQVFSRDVTSLYETGEVLSLVTGVISRAMKVGAVSFALFDEERQVYEVRASLGTSIPRGVTIADATSGLAQRLRASGEPIVREEAEIDPEVKPLVDAAPSLFAAAGVSVVVPVVSKRRLIGMLALGSKLSGAIYDKDDLQFLTTIANQAATALERGSVYHEIQRRLSEQTLLFILSERFRGSTDFDSVMQSIVRILKTFLGCDSCALVHFEAADTARTYALDPVSLAAARVAVEARASLASAGVSGRDLFPLEPETVRRIAGTCPGLDAAQRSLVSSFLFLPLAREEVTFGVLVVPNRTGIERVDQRELELLRTIRAIISQGIALHRTVANLVSIKTYSENILNSLNEMGDTLVIFDIDGTIRRVNQATCSLLGFDESELVGRPISFITGDEDPLFQGDGFLRLVGEETVSNYDVSYRTRDGRLVQMLFSGSVMIGADGKTREVVAVARDITERLKAQELAKNLLLVKEIHHRIKNNLQVISSLLYLQSGYVQDLRTKEMFKESQNRVRSMALLHEKLYQTRNPGGVDFPEYVDDLTRNLLASYGVSSSLVSLVVKAEGITLGIDAAVPCGLIINELVSNALKHAFAPGCPGEILVEVSPVPSPAAGPAGSWYRLAVSDNGRGLPAGLDPATTESLGLKLVYTLTEQLGGAIELDRSAGSRFSITFHEA